MPPQVEEAHEEPGLGQVLWRRCHDRVVQAKGGLETPTLGELRGVQRVPMPMAIGEAGRLQERAGPQGGGPPAEAAGTGATPPAEAAPASAATESGATEEQGARMHERVTIFVTD